MWFWNFCSALVTLLLVLIIGLHALDDDMPCLSCLNTCPSHFHNQIISCKPSLLLLVSRQIFFSCEQACQKSQKITRCAQVTHTEAEMTDDVNNNSECITKNTTWTTYLTVIFLGIDRSNIKKWATYLMHSSSKGKTYKTSSPSKTHTRYSPCALNPLHQTSLRLTT